MKRKYKEDDYVNIRCTICKKMRHIHINVDMRKHYTKEYRENYICVVCKPIKKRKNKPTIIIHEPRESSNKTRRKK